MNFKKNIVLIVGGGISLLLLLAAVFYLIQSRVQLARVADDLEAQKTELTRLNTRPVFPSEQNVEVLQENEAQLKQGLADLLGAMRAGRQDTEVTKITFASVLGETKRTMDRWISDAQVQTAAGFDYGFGRYIQGEVPEDKNVSRLARQLHAVETVVHVLCSAGADKIEALSRDEFDVANKQEQPQEQADNGRSRGRGRGRAPQPLQAQNDKNDTVASKVDPDGLFTAERVSVTFVAAEPDLWKLLKLLAYDDRFMVLHSITTLTQTDVLKYDPEKSASATAVIPEKESSADRAKRIVPGATGNELLTVSMDIDVYNFIESIELKESVK